MEKDELEAGDMSQPALLARVGWRLAPTDVGGYDSFNGASNADSLLGVFFSSTALAHLKGHDQEHHAEHDCQIGQVEYACVQGSSPEEDEICHQAMMPEPVHEIAHAAGPGQRQAEKGEPRKA